jgi:DNA polymerase-3 subunit gamma/tau
VEHIRNLLVVKLAVDPAAIVELPAADIETLKGQAGGATNEQLLMLFDSLSKTLDDMRWSPHQRFTFEVGLVKACSLAPLKPLAEVLSHIKELEARIAGGRTLAPVAPIVVSDRPASYASRPVNEQKPVSQASSATEPTGDVWDRVMTALKSKKPGLASFLASSRLVHITDKEVVITMQGSNFQIEQIEKSENKSVIEAILNEVLNGNVKLRIQTAAGEAPAAPTTKGTAKKKPAEQDPLVQDALRIFDGTVVEQDGPEE